MMFGRMANRFLPAALAAVALVLALAPEARALNKSEISSLFTEANEAFQEGNRLASSDSDAAQVQYEKATLRLEHIIRDGGLENGKLYYDLGNIWYQRGDIGRAILNYLRAARYIPNNVDLLQNLTFVRGQRKDAFKQTESSKVLYTIFFWHYDVPSEWRLRLFAVCFTAFWGLAGTRLFWKRGPLTGAMVVAGVLAALLFASLTIEANYDRRHPLGVITAADTIARKGDGETYQPSFAQPLHAGTEFTVREDRGDWLYVTLPDDSVCWLPRRDVGLVRDKPGA